MKWYFKVLAILVVTAFVVGMAYREQLIRQYPSDIRHYQDIMKEISSEEYIEKLQNYTKFGKKDLERLWMRLFGPQMHYAYAIQYLGEKVNYTTEFIERHEDPIEILEYGKGRCGEFAIAYTALLISNGWEARLVLDMSAGEGNGDHVWVEVWTIPDGEFEFRWMHIDPTQGAIWIQKPFRNIFDCPFINNPYMYERDWNKEVTEVWGVEADFAERVEENYQWEQN